MSIRPKVPAPHTYRRVRTPEAERRGRLVQPREVPMGMDTHCGWTLIERLRVL